MVKKTPKERGQILIVFALGLIVLLGFVALAVDGGMIMEERRYTQTLADNASVAGVEAVAEILHTVDTTKCSQTSSAMTAAVAAAQNNAIANVPGLTLSNSASEANHVVVSCAASPAPVVTVEVMITRSVDTSFVHLFTSGQVANTVTSVVDYYPPHDIGMGNTIVALDEDCTAPNKIGVTIDGNNNVIIDKGGIWSNSCLNVSGTSLTVTVNEGDIVYHNGFPYDPSGHGTVSPDPDSSGDLIEAYDFGTIACDSLGGSYTDKVTVNNTSTLSPGKYESITLKNDKSKLTMQPGLYCLKGDFTSNGGMLKGEGVTIYLMKDSKNHDTNVKITGTGSIDLVAPYTDCSNSTCPPAINGLLFYLDPSNQGNITLEGNTTSVFTGLVYAPYGSIDVGGTSNQTTTMGIQAIADTVKVHGTVAMDLTLYANTLFLTQDLYDQTN